MRTTHNKRQRTIISEVRYNYFLVQSRPNKPRMKWFDINVERFVSSGQIQASVDNYQVSNFRDARTVLEACKVEQPNKLYRIVDVDRVQSEARRVTFFKGIIPPSSAYNRQPVSNEQPQRDAAEDEQFSNVDPDIDLDSDDQA